MAQKDRKNKWVHKMTHYFLTTGWTEKTKRQIFKRKCNRSIEQLWIISFLWCISLNNYKWIKLLLIQQEDKFYFNPLMKEPSFFVAVRGDLPWMCKRDLSCLILNRTTSQQFPWSQFYFSLAYTLVIQRFFTLWKLSTYWSVLYC